MNEEEKQAIETVKQYKKCFVFETVHEETGERLNDYSNAINIVLNLIEKLKDKNKTLESLLQGNLYEMYLYYKELANKYQANCISKDTIKEKIKEYSNDKYEFLVARENIITILNELLEE